MAEPLPVAILVEDERQIRRFVRTAMEAEGWSVHETDTLKQGLIDAGTRKPDLIILDLGMPDGDGMDFLRDDGRAIGCYANRYMTVVTPEGTPTEKSYGMSWWKSLAALERWAESHPTHVRIFGAAMKYLSTLGPAAKLRLYHEVTVARADEQFFEYADCHPQTGMLNAMHTVDAT